MHENNILRNVNDLNQLIKRASGEVARFWPEVVDYLGLDIKMGIDEIENHFKQGGEGATPDPIVIGNAKFEFNYEFPYHEPDSDFNEDGTATKSTEEREDEAKNAFFENLYNEIEPPNQQGLQEYIFESIRETLPKVISKFAIEYEGVNGPLEVLDWDDAVVNFSDENRNEVFETLDDEGKPTSSSEEMEEKYKNSGIDSVSCHKKFTVTVFAVSA